MSSQNEIPGGKPKDTRFDLSIDPEYAQKLIDVIDGARELAKDRPLATVKVCLDMQKLFRVVEQEAAERANGRFHISWKSLSNTFGKSYSWGWERYVSSRLSHPKSRRQSSSKESPTEVEE